MSQPISLAVSRRFGLVIITCIVAVLPGCAAKHVSEPGEVVELPNQPETLRISRPSWPEDKVYAASAEQLAMWLFPEHASLIVHRKIERAHLGDSVSIVLYENPRVVGPELCSSRAHYVTAFLELSPTGGPIITPSSQGATSLYRTISSPGRCVDLPTGHHGFNAETEEQAAASIAAYTAAHRGLSAKRSTLRLKCSSYRGDCAELFTRLSARLITSAYRCDDARSCHEFGFAGWSPEYPDGWLVRIHGRGAGTRVEITPAPMPPVS